MSGGGRYTGKMAGLAARRRRTALAGAAAAFLLPVIAVWAVLYLMSAVAGGGRYFPVIVFGVFWTIAGIALVAASLKIGAAFGGTSRTARELGSVSGRGSLFVSALEFARGGDRLGAYSPFLVEETVRIAGEELDSVDASPVIVSAGRPAAVAAAFALGLAVLLLAVFDPGGSLQISEYISDPGISFRGDPVNGLAVPGRDIEIISGEDVTVSAVRLGSRRDPVSIEWSTVPDIWRAEAVEKGVSGAGDAELESYSYTFAGLREDLVFRFAAGDEKSAETRIVVARRPVINRISARLDFPPYTGLGSESVETLTGTLTAPVGTKVALSGETSIPVVSGEIDFGGGEKYALEPAGPDSSGEVAGTGFAGSFTVSVRDTAYITVTGGNGLASERPWRMPVVPVVDQPPSIEILAPDDGDLLPRNQRVRVVLRAADDYGLSRIDLYWMMERRGGSWNGERIFPDGNPGAGAVEGPYMWSLEDVRISPGDRVLFYLEAADNNGAAGPSVTRTETRALRVPSLSELYADSRDREELQQRNMEDILEEGEEIRERIAELSEEIRAEGEMDWSRRTEAGELLEMQRKLREKLSEASNQLGETLERLDANRMTSSEVGEKLEQIQSLIEEIQSTELAEAMEQLRRLMEDADPGEVASMMQDIEMTSEKLMENLDRTIELLQHLLDEQRVEEMMRRMEEMIAEQRELRDSTGAAGDDAGAGEQEELGDRQEKLGDEYSEFEEDLGRFSEETDESRAPGLEEASEKASESKVDSLMRSAAQDIRAGQMDGACSKQSESLNEMLSLYTRLGKCQMSMSTFMEDDIKEQVERAVIELIDISQLQEEYASKIRNSGGKLPQEEMTGGQLELRDAVATITDGLSKLARRSMKITGDAFRELGWAIAAMEEAMTSIESRKWNDGSRLAASAPEHINLAAIYLLQSTASSGGAAAGGGQSMQQLSGGQSKIDSGMREMMGAGGEGWSMQQRAEMARIAAEQRSMQELMEQILEEGRGSQQMLGDLSDVGSEMEEIARMLERGELDGELMEREERVLSRLLESQRSLNRRDYSRRRESETGGDLRAVDPGPRSYTPDQREVLLERIRRGMRAKGPAEYEELNKLYFRALSGKAREN